MEPLGGRGARVRVEQLMEEKQQRVEGANVGCALPAGRHMAMIFRTITQSGFPA